MAGRARAEALLLTCEREPHRSTKSRQTLRFPIRKGLMGEGVCWEWANGQKEDPTNLASYSICQKAKAMGGDPLSQVRDSSGLVIPFGYDESYF